MKPSMLRNWKWYWVWMRWWYWIMNKDDDTLMRGGSFLEMLKKDKKDKDDDNSNMYPLY